MKWIVEIGLDFIDFFLEFDIQNKLREIKKYFSIFRQDNDDGENAKSANI